MRVIIVLYQNIEKTLDTFLFKEDDFIVGVEKGIIQLYDRKIKFDLGVGDFDSTSEEEFNLIKKFENIYFLNKEKDETDLLVALKEVENFKYEEILVLGGISGNRVEHFYCNILLLQKYKFTMIDDNSKICIIENSTELEKDNYNYISIFGLEKVVGLSLAGFKYKLENYAMQVDDTIGISNEFSSTFGKIVFEKGRLLCILSK